ncbi:hypothetical protein [Marinobacter sp.]|uniref:hypothetical protein n=1 Tax=Marinobacter sp. TaxID=50741 RepID=UPI003A8F888A
MKRILTTSALALLFSTSTVALGQEVLDGKQISDLLVGNTLQADYQEAGKNRHTFYEYFSEDGKIYGQDKRAEQTSGYTQYLGTWEVKEGEFCVNIGYGHRGGCSVFEKVDEDTYMRKFDGFEIDRVKVYEGRHHPIM